MVACVAYAILVLIVVGIASLLIVGAYRAISER